ncbi:MAG: hypothetical protein ACI4QR_05355 [Eubacteriales bacterium]
MPDNQNYFGTAEIAELSAERITKVEQRAKSNTHRIDRLENLADAINRQNETAARLVEKLEAINASLALHEKRLSEMEKLPRTRLDAVFIGIVSAISSALITSVLTMILSSV